METLQSIQNKINETRGSWDDYNNQFQDGRKYLLDYAKQNNILESSVDNVKEANQQARASAIAHNEAIKAQTLSAKVGSAALKGLAIAGNMIAFAVITKTAELAAKAIDNYVHRVEKANDVMKSAVFEYDSAKSSLEDITSELVNQSKRMDELLSKDKLTYAEKGELEKLQAITKELLIQQDIEEKRVARASKKAAEETVKAYNTQYGNIDGNHLQGMLDSIDAGAAFITPADENDILGAIASYIKGKELYEEAEKNYIQAMGDGLDTTWAESSLQSYRDLVDGASEILEQGIADIQEKCLAMEEEYNRAIVKQSNNGSASLTSFEKDIIETYENAHNAIKMFYEYTDKNTWNEMQIQDVFNTDGIEKTKDELIKMANAGELSPDVIEGYKKLNDALQNTELFLDQNTTAAQAFYNYILACVNGTSQLNEFPIEPISFNLPSYEKQIDDIQSSITTLRSALDSLNSGELSKIEVTDLMQKFPGLVPYIDLAADGFGNLSEGLSELIEQQPSSLINSLEELKDSLDTDEEREQINLLIDSLQRLSSYGDTGTEAYATTIGNTWGDTENVIEGVITQFENLATIQEAVANGLTMSATAASELAKIYPEILTNATTAADGQITLNSDVVKNILAGDQSIVNAQIAKLEADKAELTAKKEYAEAQLNILKQVGEGEGKISKEVAQYRIDTANEKVQALIDIGLEEDKAYAAVAASMAGNIGEYNRIVGEVALDTSNNMGNAAASMAQSVSDNVTKAQQSFINMQKVIHSVADSMKAMANGEHGAEATVLGGAGSVSSKGISISSNSHSFSKSTSNYKKRDISLNDFESQLEIDIKGYTDAISSIDAQIDILKNLQAAFDETINSGNGGIGGHNYSDKIKALEKEKERINNSGSSGSGGSGKSAKEETKEEIDWIERKNEILKRQHDINEKIANDSTQSYNERISAIDSLIAQDKERMEVAIQSAERYKQAWNEAIKNIDPLDISKIMTGAIDINEYSGDYADQINEAMGLYDQMVDYEEQAAEIQEESTNHIREQVKLREEIIKAQQDEINNEMNIIKSRMELVEAQGGVLNEGMYRQQIALSKELSSSYEDQIDNLHEQLDLVDDGSAEYYSILASINDCEKAIIDCKIQQEEWNEAIQRLPIERIQKYINELQNIKQDMENFLSERSTMGFSTTKPQYQQLIDISEEEIKKLLEQQGKLKDLLKNYSYGSEKFNDVSGEIQDIDNQISSLIQKQLEYNNAILQIPVEKAQQYIDAIDQARADLDNHINEQKASGRDININEYELLNMLANEKLRALSNQKDILTELLNVYDKDTDKYRDTVAQIQDVEDAMSSVVQEQHKWNEEILQIPIDKLSDVNDILSRYSDVLNSTLNDYDQALAGVNGLLDDQIDKLNDLKDAAEEEYEARIEPLQKQLELLQKTNEERKVQNDLEQAEYDLDRAKNQKTTQVVRNGEVNYEADINAIRDANAAKADAEYNKIVYDLETQIENLETQRDELLKGYDEQIDRLDKIKDKWSEITDKIQLAIDMQKAEEIFGKGWENKILSGNDNDLYEAFKKWYTDVSNEKNQADESIASNDRISEMMSLIVDKYRSGEMSYEQAIKEIASLSSAMKDGYTSIEQLEALMKMDGIKDVSGIVDVSQKDILDTATLLSKYLGIVNKNEQSMNGYTSSWDDVNSNVTEQINAIKSTAVSLAAMQSYFDAFQKNADAITKHTSTWEEMQKNIADQIEALRKAAEALEKQMAEQKSYSSGHSYSSSSGGSGGSSSSSSGGGGSYVAAGPGFSASGMKDAIDRGDKVVFDGSGSGGYSEKDIKDMYDDYVGNAQKRHKGAELGPIGKSSESQKDNLFQQFATKTLEPGEQLLIAQDKEWVLNQGQRDNILNAIGMNPVPITNSMPAIPDFVKGNTMQDINVQFGDIVLPEVKRPDDFAKAIDNLFVSSMRQNFSKVFK